jgi:acyl transferase domain-containing protein/phosphopantetheinyl transferase (holo-ACP synthase)
VTTPDGAERRDGVAIVGMACLFPGARNLDAYWQNILGKVDATSDPPPEAWDPDVYYDPEFADEDRTYCKRGGYLGSMARFDPLEHGIPPVAVGGEPDQWLALQIARDALADAGLTDLPQEIRARTAIVLGKGTYLNGGNAVAVQRGLVIGQTLDLLRQLEPERPEDELERLRDELQAVLPPLGPETVPGLIPNIIVGRIANRLDLMGPAYTVDAACASSLVAVQHAVRDLLAGDCDLALAGGSQVWMPVATLNLFCRLGALSRRQQLRAFDKDADGTLLGEGIGAVVLKRADDAVRDGDRVYAVIRGVGVASDGRGMSVMAPRVEGEVLALQRAYSAAGVSTDSIGLVEAHGTGTPVGDVTEVQALTQVFGERDGLLARVALGTVKSMIGHTIPAAGVAALIKTALALHHQVLPPTLGCEQPNPELGLERTPFYINTETRPWIHGGAAPRRAGINAFGFGGINAHAVLEEWDGVPSSRHRPPWDSEVCILQGDSQEALADAAGELAAVLEGVSQPALADLALTLGRELGGAGNARRLAIVASSTEDLRKKLGQAIERLADPDCRRIKTTSGIYYEAEPLGREGKLVFVFPGEGAQYPNMLADLCLQFPEARAAFDRVDRLYAEHPRGHLLSDWVYPVPAFSDEERQRTEARLMEMDIAVEAVLTANAAVHGVVSRLVPRYDAMLGHSTGEHSAAMAVGALDVETDERLAAFCHGLYASYADAAERHDVPAAVLLAIGGDADTANRIAAEAKGELFLAMDNCPHQAVLVGEAGAVARAREIALAAGLMCEELPYDRAVHTPLFAPFAEDLRATFARLPVRTATTPLWSCTTAAPYPDDPEAIRELLVEHWTRPVRFRETIEALYDDGARVFVEVGPRGNMTSFMEDILRGRPACAVASDLRRRSGTAQLNHLVGRLAVHDVELDLDYLFAQRSAQPVDWRRPAAPQDNAGRLTVALSTTWPTLRLSDEALERVRPSGTDAAADGALASAPAPMSAPPAANGNGSMPVFAPAPATLAGNGLANGHHAPATMPTPAAPAHTENGSNGHHATAPIPIATPPPQPISLPAPTAPPVQAAMAAPGAIATLEGDAAAALEGFMGTMEEFLITNEEVMSAYLGGSAALAGERAQLPLVGTIVVWEPEIELVAQRVVDPLEDRYLLDHTLGRDVSHTDPGLHALPLMPLAMSIEILAEAASCLLPDRVLTGLRDLHAHRWLAFGESRQTLEVSARRLAGDGGCERVQVQLCALDDSGAPGDPIVEATMLLADDFPPAPAPAAVALHDGRPSRWQPGQLYEEAMFHQPLWRGVASVDLVAPTGAHAQLEVLPRRGLLADDPEPGFVLDPVVLDSAGQVVGFWAADMLEQARVVFPFRLAAMDLYGPTPPEGERLSCLVAITLASEHVVCSDIDVLDGDGSCWMRLTGWEDKRFAVPERFAPLARPTRLTALSTPWPAPLEPYPDQAVACRRLDARLVADRALWKPVWACRVLGRRERELFASLALPETRQLEWLAARTAAKECVAELVRGAYGLELAHADIEILPDERGAPVVVCPALDGLGGAPAVSLTHAHGQAVALVAFAPAGAGVGIDVERLVPRPQGFLEAALTEAERCLLEPLGADAAEEWLLRMWCAREAAGKALGTGLGGGSAAPRVSALDVSREALLIDAAGRQLVAWTHREEEMVVATAFDPGPGSEARR